jgi:hypothetical protein
MKKHCKLTYISTFHKTFGQPITSSHFRQIIFPVTSLVSLLFSEVDVNMNFLNFGSLCLNWDKTRYLFHIPMRVLNAKNSHRNQESITGRRNQDSITGRRNQDLINGHRKRDSINGKRK